MIRTKGDKEHLLRFLKENIRYDGRKLDEFRNIEIKYGIVSTTAEGSAYVKVGETEVIAGVKLSVDQPYPDTPDEGNLMVDVALPAMASPEFEFGPPDIQSIEYSRVIDRGLREGKVIDLKELCIVPGEKVWAISIDVVVINDGGNILDTAGIAAMAALIDTRFPKLVNNKVDYHEKTEKKLNIKSIIIPVTVYKIGDYLILDPSEEEEAIAEARLTVTTKDSNTICALQKGGDYPINKDELDKMLELAIKKGEEIRKLFKK